MPPAFPRIHCAALCLLVALGLLWPAETVASEEEALARRLLNSQGCKACHPFESQGEFPAPALDRIGQRLSKEQIRRQLTAPDRRHAAGKIIDFSHLADAEIDALVAFLSQRK